MKVGLKARLLIISLIPLFVLISTASYFVYDSYEKFKSAEKLKQKLVENKYLNDMLKNIARERGMSAMYLGKASKATLESLKKQRVLTNKVISKYLSSNQAKKNDTKRFHQLLKSVEAFKKVRALVDKRNIKFDDMFKTYSLTQLEIIKYIQNFEIENINQKINSLFLAYVGLIKAKEYSGIERGYISYIIAKQKALDVKQLNILISVIGKSDAISYNNVKDKTLRNKLDMIFGSSDALELFSDINKQRANIFASSKNGRYNLSAGVWFAMVSEKIKLISKAEDILSKAMDDEADKIQHKAIETLLIFVIVWIVFLILAILGFILSNQISKNIKGLEKILKKVAKDTDSLSEFEIDLDTAKGTSKAYRLLERIIEQTKRDKEIALQANEAKSMFLANMSHEIRTPLNGIVGFTELLKDTELSEEQMEFIEIIEKSSENLLEIINNILDLSKIESNKLEIENIVFNPIDEFESAVEVYAVRANEKNIHLSCFIDPRLSKPLKGDPTKIKEVIINLLSNAVKFTSSGGSIDIDIRVVSQNNGHKTVTFKVSDTGVGVTSEQKAKIFDAFSQADISITRKYGGTGLGLTISSRFIELMGGELSLESEPGEGTTFFFTVEFEEIDNNEEELEKKFKDIKALIFSNPHKSKKQEEFLEEYLEYFGVSRKKVDDVSKLSNVVSKERFDLLFVDFDYVDENELKNISKLDVDIVLMMKSFNMKKVESLNLKLYKTIYEPLNTSKIISILKNYKKSSTPKIVKKEETIEISSFKDGEARFNAKVLIVEDNIINQKLIKRTLQDLGLDVEVASNGLEAFVKRKDNLYDIIFMDIQMPFLDGVEATKEIISWEKEFNQKHIPIVALTANALKGDKERFLSQGLDAYTTKPLVRDEIVSILKHYLKSHIRLKEENNLQKPKADILICKKTKFETKIFSKTVSSLGYTTDVVLNFDELLENVSKYNYKLVILDAEVDDFDIDKISQKNNMLQIVIFKDSLTEIDKDIKEKVDIILDNKIKKDKLQEVLVKMIKGSFDE